VNEGSVAVDSDGTLAAVSQEEADRGFPLAPELLLDVDGPLVLDVRRSPDAAAYARWSPVDQARGAEVVIDALRGTVRTFGGAEERPARRPEWFVEGWLPEVEAWVDGCVSAIGRRRTGDLEPVKVWCLSAVLRVPTDRGVLFFKAACEWFRAEPRITEVLAGLWPDRVPGLVATEPRRGWQLMEPLSGVSIEDDPDPGLAAPTAAAMAALQVEALDRLDLLREAGLPDRGLSVTLDGLREVAEHSREMHLLDGDERAAVRAAVPRVERRLAKLAAWEVPETLIHGDLHLGNIASHEGGLVIFDWTDACLSHPFVDLATLLRASPEDTREQLRAAYLDVWRPHVDLPPGDEVEEAAFVVERAYQALTYERIQASLEDASRWEFEGVVTDYLRRLVETV
jgi:aminoglycoside phosphotransferase (APT) family kinase protein